MKPIKQTIHTDDDGNCLAACLASILEMDINAFPDLPKKGPEWYPIMNGFLNRLGYTLLLIEKPHPCSIMGYHLMIGRSKATGMQHCVVAYHGIVMHDPSPDRNEFSTPLEDPYYGFLVKIFFK